MQNARSVASFGSLAVQTLWIREAPAQFPVFTNKSLNEIIGSLHSGLPLYAMAAPHKSGCIELPGQDLKSGGQVMLGGVVQKMDIRSLDTC